MLRRFKIRQGRTSHVAFRWEAECTIPGVIIVGEWEQKLSPWVGTSWPRSANVYSGTVDLPSSGLAMFADELGNAGAFGSYAGTPDDLHHMSRAMKNCLVCIAKEPKRFIF